MLLALALTLGTVAVGERPSEPLPLERLVLDCDRIVRARIASVHEFARGPRHLDAGVDPPLEEPTIRVFELQVEETYWGRAEEKSLFVVDDAWGSPRLHGRPETGDVSIWFLELHPWFERLDSRSRERIAKLAGSPGPQIVAEDGLGRLRIEAIEPQSAACMNTAPLPVVCLRDGTWVLPPALTVLGRHSTSNPDRGWIQVARFAFEDWLRTTIHAATPSVEIVKRWTAPGACPILTFDRHGHAQRVDSYLGDKQHDFAPGTWETILLAVRRERFLELPASVGNSLGPDSTTYLLRVRTEAGGRKVRICGPADPGQDSASALEARARAQRVWEAIPLANEWTITGH